MHVIACNEIYYIVLQIHYMSLHRGVFADDFSLRRNSSSNTDAAAAAAVAAMRFEV